MRRWLTGHFLSQDRVPITASVATSRSMMIAVAAVAVSLPILVVLVVALTGETWFPGGDMAQAELHMRGFFAHPPLVGAAGRIVSDTGIQGSHPGPSLWLAMLPVYLLGGRSSAALMAAVVSVHLISVVVTLWLAHRRGGRGLLAAMAVGLLVIIRSSGPDFVIEPWNPWLAVLPFAVFIFLVAEIIEPTSESWNRQRHLVVAAAVVVGSHCIQSHAGYVVIVLGALGLATVSMVWSQPKSRRWGMTRRVAIAGGATGMVVWFPPLVDQMRRDPGNLEILWQHFASPSEPTMTLAQAGREIATQVNLIGPWLTGPQAGAPALGWARYAGCVALLALGAWCWRIARSRQWNDLSTMLMVSAVLTLIGALAISRIFGPFFEYTIRWMWILVSMTVSVCVVILGRLSAGILLRHRHLSSTVFAALITTLIVGTALQLADRFTLPGPTDSRITGALHDQLRESLDPSDRYLVRFYDPYTLNATGFGVTLALERSGFDVGVDSIFAAAALPHRIRLEESSDVVLWVVVGPAITRAKSDPDLDLVAFFDPRTAEEQTAGTQLLQDIAQGLAGAGREELLPSLEAPGASLLFAEPPLPADVAELVRLLVLLGQPVGVFAMPPGAIPASLQ